MIILNKKCVFCGDEKPITEFNKNKECSLGVNNKCKQCVKEYRKSYNQQNKKSILKYNTQYNQTYNKEWAKQNTHIKKWRDILYRCLIYKGKKRTEKQKIC